MPGSTDNLPPAVLAGFGVSGTPISLEGGDEISLVVDSVVLKRVLDPTLATWTQALLDEMTSEPVRVPTPIRSLTGEWVIDGWTATEFIPELRSGIGRWRDIADAGRAFNKAAALHSAGRNLAPVLARVDRWAIADRVAWEEVDVRLSDEAALLLARLRTMQGDATTAAQIVHGDLTGNVFFDRDDVPTVLDFSPLVRPLSHSLAIIAADAMLWHGADAGVIEQVNPGPGSIARALMFRLVSEQLASDPRHGARLDDYRHVVDSLGW